MFYYFSNRRHLTEDISCLHIISLLLDVYLMADASKYPNIVISTKIVLMVQMKQSVLAPVTSKQALVDGATL